MAKNVTFKVKVDDVIHDAFSRTDVNNVLLDDGSTLASKLDELSTSISNKMNTDDVNSAISTAINNVVDNAPVAYDTLKEIADYIDEHGSAANALTNKIETVEGSLESKASAEDVNNIKAACLEYGVVRNIVDSGNCGAQGANATYTLDDQGLLVIEGKGELATGAFDCYDRNKLERCIVKSGITSISDSCFNNTSLLEIVLPDGITKIGEEAFYYSALTKINFPSTVRTIGDYAFSMTQLKEIIIPDSVTNMGLCSLGFNSADLKKIKLSNNLIEIPTEAFVDTRITSIFIPLSVIRIGNHPFSETPLTDIYYQGTKEQWDSIEKVVGQYNYDSIPDNVTIHYNCHPDDGTLSRNNETIISELKSEVDLLKQALYDAGVLPHPAK